MSTCGCPHSLRSLDEPVTDVGRDLSHFPRGTNLIACVFREGDYERLHTGGPFDIAGEDSQQIAGGDSGSDQCRHQA